MGIGLDDYKFGKKNNWRRWAWNRIRQRLNVPIKDAIGLYLPSEQNLDLDIAMDKGFKPNNLFAIEKRKEKVALLRSRQVNVISGDLADVILAWRTPKLDFILADTCSSLDRWSLKFINCLCGSGGLNDQAVLIMNLQRGREQSSLGRHLLSHPRFDRLIHSSKRKHRGVLFSLYFVFWTSGIVVQLGGRNIEEVSKKMWNTLEPEFNSYRSNQVMMDSVAMNLPGWFFRIQGMLAHKLGEESVLGKKDWKTIIGKIAAAKAIRTMRAA